MQSSNGETRSILLKHSGQMSRRVNQIAKAVFIGLTRSSAGAQAARNKDNGDSEGQRGTATAKHGSGESQQARTRTGIEEMHTKKIDGALYAGK